MECGKLGPAFAACTISEEESGGKPPHSKNSGPRLRKDRVCPESFGNLIPTQNVEQPHFLSVKSVKSLSTVASCPPELQRRRMAKADAVKFLRLRLAALCFLRLFAAMSL